MADFPRFVLMGGGFRAFLKSLGCALAGLRHGLQSERHLRLHVLAGMGVIVLGVACKIARWEWAMLILCIGLVASAECLNTAVERLADRITKQQDPLIAQAKDVAAGAVLLASLAALIVGGIIFLPCLFVD